MWKEFAVVRVIEHLEGCYAAEEVPFGVVYEWSPECVVIECECASRTTLTAFMTICSGCGIDHAEVVRRELGTMQTRAGVKDLHPWRYAGEREGLGLPC